jgi:hypothetical protein
MKPTIGRQIIVKGIVSNGSNVHPAVVTRVWSDAEPSDAIVLVNATVFLDHAPPLFRGSIRMVETEAAGDEYAATCGYTPAVFGFWPPRA